MHEVMERIPCEELQQRWDRCRSLMQELVPRAGGMLVFSRANIYWLSGHWANGVFWLPLEGDPVLLVRKGKPRAELESSVTKLDTFKSFKELPQKLQDFETGLSESIAVEKNGLLWGFGENLQKNLSDCDLLAGDQVLAKARAVKSSWELEKMRLAGQRHYKCMFELIPQKIKPDMSEWEISIQSWQEFFSLGHHGLIRMNGPGEELFLGAVSAGDSGIYSTVYNGPVGSRGVHPAIPQMGYAGKIWQKGEILTMDTVFSLEGYHTDKTQIYFAGTELEISDQIKDAQKFCMELQQEMSEMLTPDYCPQDIYDHCYAKAQKQGFSEGFMGLGDNKVPFMGHGIGLHVDEWPPLARRFTEPFQEGMVMALEPKVGIPEVGMVGVENTFLVASKGGEALTGEYFDIICIE